ncbi:cytochrome c [Mucilaginibacter conchicola]|uniref:Cytochrome c n=1 Tax=Mucilaginibacter conchicola TaxID=2303333 RepID=A0A372NWM7_9SPHI|nr:cytochrome c [Mucilaginibacter conchicola]RFZ94510.1 cytochrome c [Mucilaginibacter conchicola]
MKLKLIGGIIVLISVLIAACQNDADQDFKRYYTGGAAIYKQKCENCHGNNGEGLTSLIPPLTDTAFLKKNRDYLACIVHNGITERVLTINSKAYEGSMPANTDLAPMDVAKVLTFVTNSFGNKQGTITVDVVEKDLAACP